MSLGRPTAAQASLKEATMKDKGSILIEYKGHFIALEKWQAGYRRRQKVRRLVGTFAGIMVFLMVLIAGIL